MCTTYSSSYSQIARYCVLGSSFLREQSIKNVAVVICSNHNYNFTLRWCACSCSFASNQFFTQVSDRRGTRTSSFFFGSRLPCSCMFDFLCEHFYAIVLCWWKMMYEGREDSLFSFWLMENVARSFAEQGSCWFVAYCCCLFVRITIIISRSSDEFASNFLRNSSVLNEVFLFVVFLFVGSRLAHEKISRLA